MTGVVSCDQQAVLSLIAQYEDVNALLHEGTDFVATNFVSDDVFHQPTVDGVLSALEDRCLVTSSPVSIISAAILGDKLRSLSIDKNDSKLLTDDSRSLLITTVEVCRRLQSGPGFNLKTFVKSLSREEMPNLEVIWRLHVEGLVLVESFIASNLSRPLAIKGLAQSIASLCCRGENGEHTKDIRQQMVTGLVNGLLRLDDATANSEMSDSTARGLKKVSAALLDSITKKILLMDEASLDVSPFSELKAVDCSARNHYCTRQLNVILSTNAILKVSDALMKQCKWTSLLINPFMRIVYQQLLDAFNAQEVISHLRRALDFQEVNWQSVLNLTAVTLTTFPDAANLVGGFIHDLIGHSLEDGDPEGLIAGTLLARQACLEGPHIFMSYTEWFQKSFSTEKNSLCGSKKSFSVFCKFLSDIVPYESGSYLKVHILKPPFVPAKCRPLWADYVLLAKTRLIDLKESLDDQPLDKDLSNTDKTRQLSQLIEADIEKALSSFVKNGKIPTSVMEASIFRKPYFVGRFLPALLQPRPLPDVPDLRMKFIDALLKAGKLQEAMFNAYKAECIKLAAQLLEGVFSDEEDDAGLEMLLSVEEQFQRSLDLLRDAVIVAHGNGISTVEGARPFVRQLAALSEKINMLFNVNNSSVSSVTLELLVINVCNSLPEGLSLKVAQMLLNSVCQTVSRLFEIECDSFDESWLTDLLFLLRRHIDVYSAMCCLICHLIEKRSNSLLACHIHGLAAIAFHWTRLNDGSPILVVSSDSDKNNADGIESKQTLAEHVLSLLPMSTPEEMMKTLQFAVSFLKYAAKVDSNLLFKKLFKKPVSDPAYLKASASNCPSDGGEMLELFCSIIPDQIGRVISYLGPRLFVELRSSAPVTLAEPMSARQSVVSFLAMDFVWQLVKRKKMSFELWVHCELEGPCDGDSYEYYNWVVYSSWHLPTSIVCGSNDPPRIRSFCVSLANAMLEYGIRQGKKRKICHHCQPENVSQIQRKGGNKSTLTQLLQRLSYLSYHQDIDERTAPWVWSVFEQRSLPPVENGASAGDDAISLEAETRSFCEQLQSLPPGVLLLSCPGETTVLGINELRDVVNNHFRNYVGRGIALPVGLISHILLMLAPLPRECVGQFLEECPIVLTSVMVHWLTVGHIVESSFSSLPDVCQVVAFVHRYNSVHELADMNNLKSKQWLLGVAAYNRILHAKEDPHIENVLQLLDSTSAMTLLHCLTLDAADRLLCGEPDRTDLLEAAQLVWSRFRDCLQTLFDDADKGTSRLPLSLCASDTIMQLQPAICLRLLTQSLKPDCMYRPPCSWNPTCALRWYITCTKQFISGTCSDSSLISVLETAAKTIETFFHGMSRKQMLAIDPAVLNLIDPQLRFIFNRQFEYSL